MPAKKKSSARKKSKPKKNRVKPLKEETVATNGSLRSSLGSGPQSLLTSQTSQAPALRGELSGDLEGLETDETEGFESVTELAEEGQDYEAERLEAIERAPDPDQSELKPRRVPNRKGKFEDRNRI
jgi:hypothetical protein